MIDSGYVAAFLNRVLEEVVKTFDDAGVELPERRFITFGTPASDTEQVTVALEQLYLGSPGLPPTEPSPCNSLTTAVIRVEILREVPVPTDRRTMVSAEKMNAAGTDVVTDAELLLQSVVGMCGAGWGGMGIFADVQLPTEEGMHAGPVMTLTAGVP